MIGKMLMGAWSMLAEVVKSGRPLRSQGSADEQQAFFAGFVPAIFPPHFLLASAALKRLPAATRRRIRRILDIGAGSAPWSIPFAKAIRAARVTAADYPAVTQITRQYAQRWGVADRYDYAMSALHKDSYLKTITSSFNYARTLELEKIRMPAHVTSRSAIRFAGAIRSRAGENRTARLKTRSQPHGLPLGDTTSRPQSSSIFPLTNR